VNMTEKTPGARPLTVAVVGRKGGAGKTTTSFNLAGALAARDLRTLMIDLDPQASLTGILLGERGARGIGAALLDTHARLEDYVVSLTGTMPDASTTPFLSLIPGDRTIERAAQDLSETPAGFFHLRKLLGGVSDLDAVVIDTPPALGFAIASAILSTRYAVLPTLTSQHDLDALADTLQLIADQEELGGARAVAIVPSAVRPRELHDRGAIDAITDAYGDLVVAAVPYSPRVREALAARQAMVDYDPHAPAALAYQALADMLMARRGQD